VGGWEARNAALRADRAIPHLFVFADFLHGLVDIAPIGVPIHQYPGSALASEQVVRGRVERFAFEIPQSHVDRTDRGHGYRTTAPIRAAIEVLPNVLGLKRVAPNEAGDHMIL